MEYTADFLAFMEAYPRRDRPHPRKLAYKCWCTRLKEGLTADYLIACAKKYSADMRRKGKVGTEFVLLAPTFLGPNERYMEYQPDPEPKEAQPKPQAAKKETLEDRIDAREWITELLSNLGNAKASPTIRAARAR